jgi:hypothetical protein
VAIGVLDAPILAVDDELRILIAAYLAAIAFGLLFCIEALRGLRGTAFLDLPPSVWVRRYVMGLSAHGQTTSEKPNPKEYLSVGYSVNLAFIHMFRTWGKGRS